MSHIKQDFLNYFRDLTKNNNKEWFHENKKRYEQAVKKPFEDFITDLIEALQEVEGQIPHTAKDGIMRINRDIRFSKDKTPYKTHMAAILSAHGKRNMRLPGMYIQISLEDLRIYSGCHSLEKDDLKNVRSYIKDHLEEFDKLINDKKFKEVFGEVHGEKNKRLPPEFVQVLEKQPLIANKGFYYFKKYDPESILKDDCIETLVKDYKVGYPMGQFLTKAILG